MLRLRMTQQLALLCVLVASSDCIAGDVVNDWSGVSVIQQIRSYATYTDIQLLVPQVGCGTPSDSLSWWRMPVEPTEANRYRRAIILAAFAAGQTVQLRCENSQVTDLVVQK